MELLKKEEKNLTKKIQDTNNMTYKMKGFSGFKESPVKAKKKTIGPDTGLLEAADNMDRGLTNPTSLVGMGVLGFLDGYNASTKTLSEGDSDTEKQAKEDDKLAKKREKLQNRENRKFKRKQKRKKPGTYYEPGSGTSDILIQKTN